MPSTLALVLLSIIFFPFHTGYAEVAKLNQETERCLSCHSLKWVDNQFDRLENTIQTTNEMTWTATKILSTAWEKGMAQGLPQGADIFDEAIEKKWVEQWLFYANSTRFASAMAGADYGFLPRDGGICPRTFRKCRTGWI